MPVKESRALPGTKKLNFRVKLIIAPGYFAGLFRQKPLAT